MARRGKAAVGWPTLVLDGLQLLIETLGAILLAIMTLVILWQVVSRASTKLNSPWTEEIARMLLVWFGMTGAAIGVRRGSHIGVEFLVNLFPTRLRRFLAACVTVLIMAFAVFLLVEGVELAKGCWNDVLSVTLLPRGPFVYLAVPVSALLIILYTLEAFLRSLGRKGGDAA